ncbi:MAG: hypothetical protein WBY98_00065, partial [Candidatus Sulfotelmatobacter sp.]
NDLGRGSSFLLEQNGSDLWHQQQQCGHYSSFPQEVAVCLRKTPFRGVNPQNTKARIWTHPERTAALFPLSCLNSRHHPEGKQAGSTMQQRKC